MTAKELEGLPKRYMHEVWEEANPHAVTEFLDDRYVRHLSPTLAPMGRDEQIERLNSFRAAFTDISIEVRDVIVGGDRVAFRSVRSTPAACSPHSPDGSTRSS
jgi:hypothetical protein